MTGIYKITNKVNGMCYIGQSVNIEKRWRKHKSVYGNPNAHEYDYYLYRAMRKYGIDNFDFEVIEECSSDLLNDKEKYWIEKYDSYRNGYNQTAGGESGGHSIKISISQLERIDNLLKNAELSIKTIADMFGVSYEMIQGINTGRHWHRDNIDYPIGHYTTSNNQNKNVSKNYCIDCGKEIDIKATRCIKCSRLNSRKCERPDKLTLLKMVSSMPMTSIGKYFGVTDNAVRKWCVSYEIPKNRKQALEYIENNSINIE